MNEILTIVLQVVGVIVLAIAGFGGLKLCQKFNIEIDAQKLSDIISKVQKIVDSVSQTYKNDMYDSNIDSTGSYTLTDEQKSTLYQESYDLITTALSNSQKKLISDEYGNYVDGIKIIIEALLYNSSSSQAISLGIETLNETTEEE